jgi:formylglycine-generating enzyme required for sulfatase activity
MLNRISHACPVAIGVVTSLLAVAAALAAAPQPAAAVAATTGPVAMFRDCPTCPELVRITPGRFQMGSTEAEGAAAGIRPDRAATERPAHEVRIEAPFAIGRYEVTVAEFTEFARESGRDFSSCLVLKQGTWTPDSKASWEMPGYATSSRQPVSCVSAEDAELYVQWLSRRTGQRYRLPSEAEWEYAARGSADAVRIFAPGDADACQRVNAGDASFRAARQPKWPTFACDDGFPTVAPVGQYAGNDNGLHDMLGNIAEFVADCYQPNHDGAPGDGSARKGTSGCAMRVVKGASWAAEPGSLRPAVRQPLPATLRGDGHGLRVLREYPPGAAP